MIISPEDYTPGIIAECGEQKRGRGNPATAIRIKYVDVICTFDIETTRLSDIEQSVMYVWQLHFHPNLTIVGRTWEELKKFFSQIRSELDGKTLCIFVHNLSYEFQFLRNIYNFSNDEVFAIKSRKVLKCTMYEKALEFRCSYLHCNMSLGEFTRKMGVEHQKLDGEKFDYTKIRYPWTPLSDEELQYCVHDVIGLAECIAKEMEIDGDNLYTLPLTSTGYVRRDTKRAMRGVGQYYKEQLPDYEVYKMCREAFRGGDTHANRYYSGRIIKNVKSYDRSSSYPDVVCNCEFPMSKFFVTSDATKDEVINMVIKQHKAVLMRVAISGLKLADPFWGCPYLSKDKCRRVLGGVFDNGRILSAEYLETTITDVDFLIILDEYKFEDFIPYQVAVANYGKLPQQLIDVAIAYYRIKTELKGVAGEEVYYMKAKNKLNSIYGMMAQDPVKQSILFNDGEWDEENRDETELLFANNKKAFLCYQWGVWVTAWARYHLHQGIKLVGDGFVYCDTDSVKYIGEVDWSGYNAERVRASAESGAYATDPAKNTHYMGVYEADGEYAEFKTLGAKKYAFTKKSGGETCVTIAGVTKRSGGKELDKHGGLTAFKPGFVFVEAGGTEAVYNDEPFGAITVENRELFVGVNVVIRESTYTLGITAEYENLLKNLDLGIDKW